MVIVGCDGNVEHPNGEDFDIVNGVLVIFDATGRRIAVYQEWAFAVHGDNIEFSDIGNLLKVA